MIKFFILPFVYKCKCWSQSNQKYFDSYNIQEQVWETSDLPLKGYSKTLNDIIPTLNVNKPKHQRDALMRFSDVDRFPVKAQVGYDKWNGTIFIDLDIDKYKEIANKSSEFHKALYDTLINNLLDNENFLYIEHSSSKVGLHMLFYYDIEKTEENFFKCAKYTKDLLYSLDNNIKGFKQILDYVDNDSKGKVFDPVYSRLYQKCYITGIDAYINDCSGTVPEKLHDYKVKEKTVDNNYYNITDVNINNKIVAPYNLCLKLYTAIKKVTKSKIECDSLWDNINKNHIINNKYDYIKRKHWFNYDSIDETTAHIEILEQFGINVDKAIQNFHLADDQYLGDIRDDILNNITHGITLLQAGTGVGKTRCWTDLNDNILNDILDLPYHKPILIVEPLNSIINTKYNESVITITGSKRFPKNLSQYSMYVTNYNKLIRKTIEDKYELREDIIDFFSKFELIVLDESHILIKDSFRCEVLIPFIDTIKLAAQKSKIILQTATPMEENKLFDINNNIIIHKDVTRNCKYIFRKSEHDKFNIREINCLITYYHKNGRKVYVYWNNGSLRQIQELQSSLNDIKVAIYHKRNSGNSDMNYINEYHELGNKYDVLISSVYFGVGNDLNDDCDTAVIIIGNNTWQEDIQAIGRWRESKDVEVCQIILPNENLSFDDYEDYDTILKNEKVKLYHLWHDKLNKDKSVIIAHKAYQINKEEDIEKLAVMKASNIYNSLLKVKIQKLQDTYYNIVVKTDLEKPLLVNKDYTEKNEEYWNEVKEIRNNIKQEILKGNVDYNLINSDSNISKWYSLYKKLKTYNVIKLIGPKKICSNGNYNMLNVWCMYYKKFLNGIDLSELFALLWYRKNYIEGEHEIDEIKYGAMYIDTITIKNDIWYSMLAYIIFIKHQNILENEHRLESMYYNTFKWYCKLFQQMPQELIDLFYINQTEDDKNEKTMIFFDSNTDEWNIDFKEEIKTYNDFVKYIETNNEYKQIDINKIIGMCLNLKGVIAYDSGKKGGKKGGKISSPKKKCVITDKIQESRINLLIKHNLTIGQEFDSCEHLAKYVNKSNTTVSQWRQKGWIT